MTKKRKPNSTRHGYNLDNYVTFIYLQLREKDTRIYSNSDLFMILRCSANTVFRFALVNSLARSIWTPTTYIFCLPRILRYDKSTTIPRHPPDTCLSTQITLSQVPTLQI
jgi:hypothetical protein